MPNIFHVCLHQDTSFTNRTKSAQSEYSCFTVVFWHLALELVWVLACLVQFWGFFWLFFLVMYVSYSFPLSLFFWFVLTDSKNRQLRMKFHSEPCELWCSASSQILQRVLNRRPWCLLLIAQSVSTNWSGRWCMLSCQNVSCSSKCTARPAAKGAVKCTLSSSSLGRIIYLPLTCAERGRTPGCVNVHSCTATTQQGL